MRSISSSFSSVQEFRDASMNRNADGTNKAQLRAACWTVHNAECEQGLRVSALSVHFRPVSQLSVHLGNNKRA